ncbi:hypothetical protein N656DRAFT_849760 [Canariomyces notabilis]|uniref:Uncharacterized protein n=1 Tax=Canariomyces notabilis TaxID=2074819 RepID=A0AAN6QB89_9PEZI|nr:hypothetical protein N656DRAFT_849760 [Canariomyces arenarius]
MASINFTSMNGTNDILMFGGYHQTIVALESDVLQNPVDNRSLLHPEEVSYIRKTAAYDDSSAAVACQEALNLRLDYYYGVRHQIRSILRVWDAVLDEKRLYDAGGWLSRSRSFMDSFRLCSYLIPQRVNIGLVGSYLDIPALDTSLDNIPVSVGCRSATYHAETSTVDGSEETAVDPGEYDKSIQYGEPEELPLSDEEEYTEALARSPTISDEGSEDVDVQHRRVEIISIPSDDSGNSSDSDSDSEYSNSSDKTEELQFPLDLENAGSADSGLGKSQTYRQSDLDAECKRFFDGLPRQPYQEAASLDENLAKRPDSSISKGGALQPRGNQSVPKRKFFVISDSDYKDDQGPARGISGKRPRHYPRAV